MSEASSFHGRGYENQRNQGLGARQGTSGADAEFSPGGIWATTRVDKSPREPVIRDFDNTSPRVTAAKLTHATAHASLREGLTPAKTKLHFGVYQRVKRTGHTDITKPTRPVEHPVWIGGIAEGTAQCAGSPSLTWRSAMG